MPIPPLRKSPREAAIRGAIGAGILTPVVFFFALRYDGAKNFIVPLIAITVIFAVITALVAGMANEDCWDRDRPEPYRFVRLAGAVGMSAFMLTLIFVSMIGLKMTGFIIGLNFLVGWALGWYCLSLWMMKFFVQRESRPKLSQLDGSHERID